MDDVPAADGCAEDTGAHVEQIRDADIREQTVGGERVLGAAQVPVLIDLQRVLVLELREDVQPRMRVPDDEEAENVELGGWPTGLAAGGGGARATPAHRVALRGGWTRATRAT